MKSRSFVLLLIVACAFCLFQCADEEEAPKSASSQILSFKIPSLTPEVIGVIDDAGKKIALVVPHGTDVTALAPVIEVSEKATVAPASAAVQDFSNPVTYTVTAENGSNQQYLVTIMAEQSCLPTTLPAEETYLKLTYNHNADGTHSIDQIEYLNFDVPEPGKIIGQFEYADGKLSKIDLLVDGQVDSYVTFQYPTGKIIENHFNKPAGVDFEKVDYYVYYIKNNSVSGRTYHDVYNGYAMQDSLVYVYDNAGNITHADGYDANKVKAYTIDFAYDDKPNPYHLAGINEADNEFYTPLHLSVNNVTRAAYTYISPVSEEVEITSYTYDASGNPITRNASWDDAVRNMAYICH